MYEQCHTPQWPYTDHSLYSEIAKNWPHVNVLNAVLLLLYACTYNKTDSMLFTLKLTLYLILCS